MTDQQKQKLWEEYASHKSPKVREKLILEYSELVKIIAGRLSMYLGKNVEYDDMIGYGSIGLIDAVDKFDYKKGVKFETYASIRIRGAIIDEIRKLDWVPRTVRQKQRDINNAKSQVELETGKPATNKEIAYNLDITEEELSATNSELDLSHISSLDEYLDGGSVSLSAEQASREIGSPEKNIEIEQLKQDLTKVIETLTKRERQVITLYYYEELTLKEISYILKITESRVSQLHRKGLEKMKERLGDDIQSFFISSI